MNTHLVWHFLINIRFLSLKMYVWKSIFYQIQTLVEFEYSCVPLPNTIWGCIFSRPKQNLLHKQEWYLHKWQWQSLLNKKLGAKSPSSHHIFPVIVSKAMWWIGEMLLHHTPAIGIPFLYEIVSLLKEQSESWFPMGMLSSSLCTL